jgi:hypothetical protein
VRAIHTPFDAFERTSDAIARGNRKVFEEIGLQFARCLETCPADAAPDSVEFQNFLEGLVPGEPPDGQDLLRKAFARYQQQRLETDPVVRAQLVCLANLEIGLHEQKRLQPEIREALEAPVTTAHDLGERLLAALLPGSVRWRSAAKRPIIALLDRIGRRFLRFAHHVTRLVITERLMVLALPDRVVLRLSSHLDAEFPEALRKAGNPDLEEFLGRFEPLPPAVDDCGAADWSDLRQRMHYAAHLFRAFHARADLLGAPFTPEQERLIRSGVIPDGEL